MTSGLLYRDRRAILASKQPKDTAADESKPIVSDGFAILPLRPDAKSALESADVVSKWNIKLSVGMMSNSVTPQLWGELFYLYQVWSMYGTVFVFSSVETS